MELGPEPLGPSGETVEWLYYRCPFGHGFVAMPNRPNLMPECGVCLEHSRFMSGRMEPWVRRASTIYIHPDGEMPPPQRRTLDRGSRLAVVNATEERMLSRHRRRTASRY